MENLVNKVIQWGDDKGIFQKSSPIKQHQKTQEEVDELKQAILDGDTTGIKDGIGDATVTLILQAELNGFTFEECLQHAYDIISKRTGKMVDGIFVKDK